MTKGTLPRRSLTRSLTTLFATSMALETEQGVWFDYDAFRVRLLRAGGANDRFSKALERNTRDLRSAARRKTLSSKVADQRLAKVFAESVVVGWETNVAEEGEAPVYESGLNVTGTELVPFTKENVEAALIALPELFAELRQQAGDADQFKDDAKEDLGNSAKSSNSGSDTSART